MEVPPSGNRRLTVATTTPPGRLSRIAQSERRPQRARPLMRKYEVAVLTANGDLETFTRVAPASPAFESAFAAFGRGALIDTDRGPVAIEDLWPGDMLRVGRGQFEPLLWKGSTMLVPGMTEQSPDMDSLIRISADALGIAKPMGHLILGPKARILHHSDAVERITGQRGAFLPVRDFLDGDMVTATRPPSPVRVFHLALARQSRVLAGGVEVETFHPGDPFTLGLRGPTLELFLSLFPQVATIEEFGPLETARLRMSDLSSTGVALA